VVPVESTLKISQIADLAAPEVKRVATGDPQAVPVGIYAREYLSKQGLWSLLGPRVVPVADVRAALAAVAAGNAEAAIVYKTDASVSPKVRIALEIVGDDAPQIRYPVAILKEAPEPRAAKSFVDYLFSTEAGAIFTKHGFPVLEQSHTK
jgi:molybdate transport system substrate-binding protein